MGSIFEDFVQGQKHRSGPVIAASLAPVVTARCPDRLLSFHYFSNPARLSQDLRYALFQSSEFKLSKSEQNAWIDVFSVYWKAVGELLLFNEQPPRGSWVNVFNAWKEVAIALIRAYQNNVLPYWTVPCLYMVGKFLRIFGIKADAELLSQNSVAVGGNFDDTEEESGKESKLKDSALVINRMFSLCLSDRAPLEESRKWAVYKMTNLLFKAYFRINAVSLSENTLKVLGASSDIPPLEAFPKSHVVTFKYYLGVISFLQEHYAEAEEHLASARQLCHKDATKNRELILMYLVCCHIVTTHTLPSKALLANFPRLEALFRPLCDCIRKGDLGGFDTAMAAGEEVFVKRRIYLPLERSRDIALRNLFRKVFIAGGFDEPKDDKPALRRTRISVNEFAAAVRIGTHADSKTRVDTDEVECLLSNLIYKGLMKGYISRERGMVVLSNKGDAFPGTGV